MIYLHRWARAPYDPQMLFQWLNLTEWTVIAAVGTLALAVATAATVIVGVLTTRADRLRDDAGGKPTETEMTSCAARQLTNGYAARTLIAATEKITRRPRATLVPERAGNGRHSRVLTGYGHAA
jgi:hypothetical protein